MLKLSPHTTRRLDDRRLDGEPAVNGSDSGRGTWRSRWWFTAATLAVGIVVGVLAVGLLNVTTPDFEVGNAQTGSNPTSRPSFQIAAEARVNAACLRVINEAQDVYQVLGDVGDAATEVDLRRLDDLVQRLQPVEPRLEADLANCSVDTSVTDPAPGSPPPGTPLPTPSPTSSPTR